MTKVGEQRHLSPGPVSRISLVFLLLSGTPPYVTGLKEREKETEFLYRIADIQPHSVSLIFERCS